MRRYCDWYEYGAYSSTGDCFDIGNATRTALENFLRTEQAYSGSADPRTAGNGSLMCMVPILIFYFDSFEQTVHYAALSSRTTHQAIEAIDICRYYAALIHGAVYGQLAGAFFGETALPIEWLLKMHASQGFYHFATDLG